jgi:hypothetical protein
MINKVENINILLKFQSGHIISIFASIRDILGSSCKRPVKNGILFIGDKTNSDPIGQHIVPYGKDNSASLSKLKLLKSNYNGAAEWVDVKSDPFVCLALKPTLTLLFVIMSLISCSRIILLESLITMLCHLFKT